MYKPSNAAIILEPQQRRRHPRTHLKPLLINYLALRWQSLKPIYFFKKMEEQGRLQILTLAIQVANFPSLL
ncbi:hypothetical protein M0R45_012610 [Rubus argutus]|uniref:Uncharacterized protein n=1 Tax=Rubus argutus TaxID=59490 RepID=A0AAW1YD74_RUBAR